MKTQAKKKSTQARQLYRYTMRLKEGGAAWNRNIKKLKAILKELNIKSYIY